MGENLPDFIAKLRFLSSMEGGRKTPAFSGYRPGILFPFIDMQTSGMQDFIDKEIVYPGETVVGKITLSGPSFFQRKLTTGMFFEFKEGPVLIGKGKIIEIMNPLLIKDH